MSVCRTVWGIMASVIQCSDVMSAFLGSQTLFGIQVYSQNVTTHERYSAAC